MGEIHRGGFTLDDSKRTDIGAGWLMKNELEPWKAEVNGKQKKFADDIQGLKMQLGRIEKLLEKSTKETTGMKPKILE